HAAVHFLWPPLDTHRLPGPPQSAFAEQDLPKFSRCANGTTLGSSSMPWMPYIVVKPHDSLSIFVSRPDTGCGRKRCSESRASRWVTKSSTMTGVDASENDVVVMTSMFLPCLFGFSLNASP